MQALLPGEDIKFSEPADVGGAYEAFQYRNQLAVFSAMGVPYMLGTPSAPCPPTRRAAYRPTRPSFRSTGIASAAHRPPGRSARSAEFRTGDSAGDVSTLPRGRSGRPLFAR
ncbi:phage portal protein [Bradyrhizobium sp. WSM1743]|uniref:phage portal protein n=1 Tax=Bradyrhizobium sp. WSM1743 TaxID=318996 RepID=UPI001FDA01DE|nr:phage portal protein [Bradyrhizobium sp. WSM1743]